MAGATSRLLRRPRADRPDDRACPLIIFGGFRTNSQITTSPAGLPNPWVLANYVNVLTSSTFWLEVGNSTIAALSTTIGVVVLGVMASYVLARYQFRGRGAMYALFAAGLMFPITVAITPLYLGERPGTDE